MERRLLKDSKKIGDRKLNTPASDLPPLLKNSAIHRKYGLMSVINEDFAGTLYATAKKAGGKDVAVKVLRDGYALMSNTLGNIEHSRICQVLHTIIERDKIQAVVFEKPEGTSLGQMIREGGALKPGQAVSAALQLLSALHAVHWNDAYVGNLHTDSIFLSRDKSGNLELQLANLGIGCIHDKLRETDYLAPEQIMGGKGGGRRSDIWAAGVILYEMIFGRRPFKGENRYATAGEILLQDPDFSKKPKEVPDDLIDIIRKAMQKDDGARFSDIAEMVSELLPFQSEFNEPMSPAARNAIRDSNAPKGATEPSSSAAKTAAKTSAASPRARVIPTVRISHTPSDPPKAAENRNGGGGRIGKKTKLGMPAISLPAKRIPLKSSDDTASIRTISSNSPAPTALLSDPPGKAVGEFPRPKNLGDIEAEDSVTTDTAFGVVTRTLSNAKLSLASAGAKLSGTFPKLIANPPKPAELRSGFLNLPVGMKVLVLGSALLFLGLLVLLISGTDDDTRSTEQSAASLASASMESYAAYNARLSSPVAPTDTATPVAEATAAAPDQAPKEVSVSLDGELPKRAKITIDEKTVKHPIVLEASATPVSLTITAKGYEAFTRTITPTQDVTIKIEMERSIKARRGGGRGRGGAKSTSKRKKKKPAKSGENLASNPFGG